MPLTHTPHAHPLLRGLAAGDRNGGPVRLALLLCRAMSEDGRFEPERVFTAYRGWFEEGDAYDTGPTLACVVELVRAGVPRAEAARRVYERRPSEGVAPAHRAAPLALWLRGAALDDALRAEAALSHHAPLSAEVSVAVGRLCAALLDGGSLREALEGLADLHLPLILTHEALRVAPRAALSPGGHAPEVLRAALWFLTRSQSLEEALSEALSFAGPANYCPVLVGSIGGCLYKDVPRRLLEHPQTPPVFF